MWLLNLLLVYSVVYAATFGCFLPYWCSSWVYSLYFDKDYFEGQVERLLKESNDRRVSQARAYLSGLNANDSKRWHQHRVDDVSLDLLVVVKTVDRSTFHNNPPTNYLMQTMVGLDREIRDREIDCAEFCIGLIMCNADPKLAAYDEAAVLSKFYPTVDARHDHHPVPEVREMEKHHLIGCLRSVADIRAQYLLIVEDDAEPYARIFVHLKRVLREHLEWRVLHGEQVLGPTSWAFLKLYYPEKWSGYSREVSHICELCGIGCVVGAVFTSLAVACSHPRTVPTVALWLHVALGACYGISLAVAIGRQHLLQLRRMGPGIVTVGEAPGCCTPAVVYPWHVIEPMIKFLSNVTCHSSYGVDLALDDFSERTSLHRFLVEPNLFHHRGVYSTLTKPKNMAEYLFDS